MPGEKHPLPTSHTTARTLFRVAGPTLLVIGAVLIFSQMAKAQSSVDSFGAAPGPSPVVFMLGGVCVMAGFVMTGAGWAGVMAKYSVREHAPAASEGINRVGAQAAPGITAIARAVRDGVDGTSTTTVTCPACNADNDPDARFCDSCGSPLAAVCTACDAVNDPDAKFCDACGHALA